MKPKPIPYAQFRAEILGYYEPPLRAVQTFRQVRQVLDELAPFCRTTKDLTSAAVASWIRAHPDRTPVRANSLLRTLRTVANWAVNLDYLGASPFRARKVAAWVRADVIAPETPRVQRHLSRDQVAAILGYLAARRRRSWRDARLWALVHVYAYLGLRKMEALRLEVPDLDLDRATLTIRPRKSWRPKTRASAATLPMAPELVAVLREWLDQCGPRYVFPGVRLKSPWTGGAPGTKALDEIKAAGKAVGIPGLTILSFRKTLGTLAKAFGVSPRALQALLRHTSEKTQEYYDEDDTEILRECLSGISFASPPPAPPAPAPAPALRLYG